MPKSRPWPLGRLLCRLVLVWLGAGFDSAAATLDYLYINASEGTASGGHVALKLDDEVYHFQHVPPGLLRIHRDEFEPFRQQYGDLENRTIRLHRLAVSAATQARLRERFHRILLIENEQFDRRDSLAQDLRLLQALSNQAASEDGQTNGPPELALPGLGLFLLVGTAFDPRAALPQAASDPRLTHLKQQVESALGREFLDAKIQGLRQSLQALRPGDYDPDSIQLAEDRFQTADYAYANRYIDQLTALAALQVLQQGQGLVPGVLLRPAGDEFILDDDARESLALYRARLETQMSGLLQSRRPDWGFPLLLGMARLIALDETLSGGRWVFLNLAQVERPDDEPPVPTAELEPAQAAISARLAKAKAGIVAAEVDEWAYAHLEQAANLRYEIDQAVSEGRSPRLAGMSQTPDRPGQARLIPSSLSPAQLHGYLGQLEIYQQAYDARLQALYAYRLLGRNCVSEIFKVLGQSPAGHGFTDIPFLSYAAVGQYWPVTSSQDLPSYRNRRLARLKIQESPLWVDLRESNVLSSSLYQWHRADSAFLFFTDDKVWPRPILGGFNLAAGLGQVLAGVFTLPWDGGENLWQGAKGSLISLPELVFFNIRKGSFPGLPAGIE